MIYSKNFFKKTIIPLSRDKDKKKIAWNSTYNDNNKSSKYTICNKIKINLLKNNPKVNYSKNINFPNKLNKNIKSAIIKSRNSSINTFNSNLMKKDKKSMTGINFYNNNKMKLKRNYSAYYIKSDLPLEKQYISDILYNSDKIRKNSKSKISEIEEKISHLRKSLNLFNKRNDNSPHLSRTISSIPLNRYVKRKTYVNPKHINSYKNKKEKIKTKQIIIPNYLKYEYNIEGTNILSPFCVKSKDNNFFQKFLKHFKQNGNIKSDRNYINNKLNIIYAENEDLYYKKLSILNQRLNKKGKNDKYHIGLSPCEEQLRDMNKKITFMKDIFEYAYPNTVLIKMRIPESKKYFLKYKYRKDFNNYEINKDKLDEKYSYIYKLSSKSK